MGVNVPLIEAWAVALESGKYKQTRGTLRKKDGFCCLGVLTDVAVTRGDIEGEWVQPDEPHAPFKFATKQGGVIVRDEQFMPDTLADMVGLNDDGGIPLRSGERWGDRRRWEIAGIEWDTLASCNDNTDPETVFTDIATALREEYLPMVKK